ncbi:MAG: hypothetical protein HYU36_12095 [Planctomycetes bacterium]|nr:hypothetical protein [Planctomycetota bacterium]
MKLLLIGSSPAIHFKLMRELPQRHVSIRLAGLALSHEDRAERAALERAAGELGVPFYEDFREGLCVADSAAHLGPYGSRGTELLRLVRDSRLKVLLVDKPIAMRRADLERLEEARQSGQAPVCLPLLSLRYDGRYRLVRALCRAGLIGETAKVVASRPHKLGQRPAWYFDRAEYPSLLADLSVHDVDMLCFVTGLDVQRVLGAYETDIRSADRSLPGLGHFGLELRGGVPAQVSADWLTSPAASYHGDSVFQATGSLGQVKLVTDGADRGLWVESRLEEADSLLRRLACESGEKSRPWTIETLSPGVWKLSCPPTDYSADFDRMFRNFLSYLESPSTPLEATMDDLVAATRVVLEAARMASKVTAEGVG